MTRDALLARLYGAAETDDPRAAALELVLEFIEDQSVTDAVARLPQGEPPTAICEICEACE